MSGYEARRTLTVPTELVRQLRRRRTLVAFGIAIALPLIVVAAVKLGPSSSGNGGGGFGDGDLDLVGLATSGAWNFALTMLFFSSGFLLTIIAAMRPVPRLRSGFHRIWFWPQPQRAALMMMPMGAAITRLRPNVVLRTKTVNAPSVRSSP